MEPKKSHDKCHEIFIGAYDDFNDAIFRHCLFRLSDRERAKDISQETFIRIWKYMSEGGEIKHMRAFVYRIANNLIIDEYRKKKTISLEKLHEEEGFDPVGSENMESIEKKFDAQAILKVLDRIDTKYREALVMRYVDDLTPKEIAEITGESENNISVRIHRGTRQLKKLIL